MCFVIQERELLNTDLIHAKGEPLLRFIDAILPALELNPSIDHAVLDSEVLEIPEVKSEMETDGHDVLLGQGDQQLNVDHYARLAVLGN